MYQFIEHAAMLTPPYHFSIAASPFSINSAETECDLLYRGSIPAERNLPFVQRLLLKTIVYLRKKALKPDDGLIQWASHSKVELRWVKAESMTEEALGMGRNEIIDTLKLLLDPSMYPLYLADLDGISHTTLVISCLRKLQGWHMSSIIDEIARFEPDHEDLPLVPFVQAFLAPSQSGSSDSAMQLPPPPYPTWLWPHVSEQAAPLEPIKSGGSSKDAPSRSSTSSLPFAHPLVARRHPNLRLIFPAAALTASPASSAGPSSLSRVNTLNNPPSASEEAAPQSLVGAATSILNSGMSSLTQAISSVNETTKLQRNVSFDRHTTMVSSGSRSPQNITRQTTRTSSGRGASTDSSAVYDEDAEDEADSRDEEDEEVGVDNAEDEDEEEEDEDEEGEDEESDMPTSQYISALDLAGFG